MQQPHPGNENRFAVVQPSGDDGEHRVRDLLGVGAPQRIGWFRFYFDDDRWEWSPQVEKMHGYLPGTVTLTTEMVLAHKHPDDYRQIADTLDLIRQTRQAFQQPAPHHRRARPSPSRRCRRGSPARGRPHGDRHPRLLR